MYACTCMYNAMHTSHKKGSEQESLMMPTCVTKSSHKNKYIIINYTITLSTYQQLTILFLSLSCLVQNILSLCSLRLVISYLPYSWLDLTSGQYLQQRTLPPSTISVSITTKVLRCSHIIYQCVSACVMIFTALKV